MDNLCVEKASYISVDDVRSAMETWLGVENKSEILEDEPKLELHFLDEVLQLRTLQKDMSNELENDASMPAPCLTSSLSGAAQRECSEDICSFLYTPKGNKGITIRRY